ncbi:hypothetical protein [Nonomuraea basaltis]|uniref:hypothetical protein n=1 Tax=Nonomuraea basaltis TaxID=2495887 RepID=UPI00110C6A8B|nr:hypothetical protein [Nonomuraea basaltis]TMS00439.1 hypothetical protein EJK15_01935 [Nonomuraea basaltis]
MMRNLPATIVAGALAAGLSAPVAAHAAAAESALQPTVTSLASVSEAAQASAQDRWSTLWYGSRNTKKLQSPALRNRAKVMQIVVQCWNGGDGTRAKAYIQRKYAGRWWTVGGSSNGYCVGGKMYHRIRNVPAGTYRAIITLSPKSHTVRAWVQNYG